MPVVRPTLMTLVAAAALQIAGSTVEAGLFSWWRGDGDASCQHGACAAGPVFIDDGCPYPPPPEHDCHQSIEGGKECKSAAALCGRYIQKLDFRCWFKDCVRRKHGYHSCYPACPPYSVPHYGFYETHWRYSPVSFYPMPMTGLPPELSSDCSPVFSDDVAPLVIEEPAGPPTEADLFPDDAFAPPPAP